MPATSHRVQYLYESLFDWQSPLSLWENSEALKNLLKNEVFVSRGAAGMDLKRVFESWVIGKSLTMLYHGSPCLVRAAAASSADGQIYRNHTVCDIEVTQALYPGTKRHVLGAAGGGDNVPPAPIKPQEQAAYARYRGAFVHEVFRRVEARIEHKFQLYRKLDYLLVYIDVFDRQNPRYGYFALQDFYDDHARDLEMHLNTLFRRRWRGKIERLFLLDDRPTGFLTPVPQGAYAELSLA